MEMTWLAVAKTAEVVEGDVRTFRAGGKEFAVYRIDGQFYATAAHCTHGFARLSDGFLEGFEIECPLHQGKFDVRTGRAMCAPLTEDLPSFPARVEGDVVLVGIPTG